ncbi:hypothetical protein FIV42_23190 [Persicimonas caeni]|uniref:Uncharacterized protein n=1 Tax=Persicimonas caeni TaxID=2292766 RepID=A0A4Y6PZ72_PERCE|nr:hypothetical protein [Persicimonas caeni]QDG53540.1 hypothetical protein FIV42_23190 [Persicimonas caeni]QED34761.1 hypothetical protein FRD00_23185 [Persicimonas caeni]
MAVDERELTRRKLHHEALDGLRSGSLEEAALGLTAAWEQAHVAAPIEPAHEGLDIEALGALYLAFPELPVTPDVRRSKDALEGILGFLRASSSPTCSPASPWPSAPRIAPGCSGRAASTCSAGPTASIGDRHGAKAVVDRVVSEFAEACGLELDDHVKPEVLHDSFWYDDGNEAWLVDEESYEFETMHESAMTRRLLEAVEAEDFAAVEGIARWTKPMLSTTTSARGCTRLSCSPSSSRRRFRTGSARSIFAGFMTAIGGASRRVGLPDCFAPVSSKTTSPIWRERATPTDSPRRLR